MYSTTDQSYTQTKIEQENETSETRESRPKRGTRSKAGRQANPPKTMNIECQPSISNSEQNRDWEDVEQEKQEKWKRALAERELISAQFSLKPTPVPPINKFVKLKARARFGSKATRHTVIAQTRSFCHSLPLNTTIVGIDKPGHAAFFRKFTPDGQFLLTFCLQSNQIIIYAYRGIDQLNPTIATLIGERGNDKHEAKLQLYGYRDMRSAETGNDVDFENSQLFRRRCSDVRQQAFSSVFRHYWSTDIALPAPQSGRGNDECQWQVQKESALFTPDSRYAVVLTYCPLPRDSTLEIEMNRRTADAITTSVATQQVQIVILRLSDRKITDRALMPIDKLAMAYNNGVQLVGFSMLVLSMQHQLIHLLDIDPVTGQLKRRQVIGTLTNSEHEFDPHFNRLFILSELCIKKVNAPCSSKSAELDCNNMALLQQFVNTAFQCTGDDVPENANNDQGVEPTVSDQFNVVRSRNREPTMDNHGVEPNDEVSFPTRRSEATLVNDAGDFGEHHLTGLRQQLSAYYYNRYYKEAEQYNYSWPLIIFHRMASWLAGLRICRAQFYGDENRLVLRYTSEEVINKKWSSANAASTAIADSNRDAPFLIVVYNVATLKIERLFDQYDDGKLLELYENDIDLLRHPAPSFNPVNGDKALPEHWCTRYPCTATSNVHAKHAHKKHKKTLLQSCGNDTMEIDRRLAAPMPYASQSYNETGYLDMQHFRYDERSVPHIERPRQAADQALVFHQRNTGQPAFTIFTGNGADEDAASTDAARKGSIVYYIWHPREPLCFSVQRSLTTNQVNMHLFVDRSMFPARSAEANQLVIR